jgi:SET domain-containing protein
MPRTSSLPFEIRRSAIQGRGAFATRPIRKGSRIVEYTGERIDQDEADRRYDDGDMKRHHTFLFALDDGTTIDGAVGGNESRYINHSCDPNCAAYEQDGRIFVEAKRAIAEGEELAYDYSYARTKHTTKEDEELYACRCGSPKCRGTILVAPKKRKPTKAAAKKKKAAKKKTAPTKKKTVAKKKTAPAKKKTAAKKSAKRATRG